MNFYKYRRDQRLYNQDHQIAYTTGYVCFMHSEGNNQVDGNWQQRYLDINQIDYNAANKLFVENFLLDSNNLEYYSRLVHYILSNILNNYFPQALNKLKVKYQDGYYLPKYMK